MLKPPPDEVKALPFTIRISAVSPTNVDEFGGGSCVTPTDVTYGQTEGVVGLE